MRLEQRFQTADAPQQAIHGRPMGRRDGDVTSTGPERVIADAERIRGNCSILFFLLFFLLFIKEPKITKRPQGGSLDDGGQRYRKKN